MSILIKGMEMPKNCTECRFAVDGWCYGLTPTEPNSKSLATGTRPSWCPLIELPPHGRLIEVDALRHWILTEMASLDSEEDREFVADRLANELPTIIEAEGEE